MPKDTVDVLEIVELPSGEVALRRPADAGEPLVTIRFSPESLSFLGNARHLIAKAMIEAGLEAVHELRDNDEFIEEEENELEDEIVHLIH